MQNLCIRHVDLDHAWNQERHRTQDFSCASGSRVLVLRRGDPFRVKLLFKGRAFNPHTDRLMVKALLGRLNVTMPVTLSDKGSSPSQWRAYLDPQRGGGLNPQSPSSVYICSPAGAPVGIYRLQVFLSAPRRRKRYSVCNFTLLCNPWCPEDSVFLPFVEQREEYVLNDSGLLYMGTAANMSTRPWSFDQFEPDVLESCLNLLQVSPQHMTDRGKDCLQRSDPVYISRVVSAMINCEDDRGVLKGNWSGDYKQGVHPSVWTGSGDILRLWAKTGFHPVHYGQCWVFAAVMCTVMRVLGIPCRVVTNFNSAHDTNGNLVIEEFYSETGMKLHHSKDSIWNFHVWVECWMTRPDLGGDMDGWQVLDPTPQERSAGVFCCGPAPVAAVRDRRIDLLYDVPFVYAEVNADVHTVVVERGLVLSYTTDTQRVGCLVCTKAVGLARPHDITGDYKATGRVVDAVPMSMSMSRSRSSVMSDDSTTRRIVDVVPMSMSRNSVMSDDSTTRRSSAKGLSVSLRLDRAPIAGEDVCFTVTVTNRETVSKEILERVNAQAKEYNHSPSDTFWEAHGVIRLEPLEVKVLRHQMSPEQYGDTVGDRVINLAVVLKDQASLEYALVSEEFNISVPPQLTVQVPDEGSVTLLKKHTAIVTFTNTSSVPVSGVLTLFGAGLLRNKIQFRMPALQPGAQEQKHVPFAPRMAGSRMLQATVSLQQQQDDNAVVRAFKMVFVNNRHFVSSS